MGDQVAAFRRFRSIAHPPSFVSSPGCTPVRHQGLWREPDEAHNLHLQGPPSRALVGAGRAINIILIERLCMKPSSNLRVVAAAVALLAANTSHADVVWYSEVNGAFVGSLNATSTLTGGTLNGQTIAANVANFRGADNFYFGFANAAGAIEWHAAIGGGYLAPPSATTLLGGALNGQSLGNNPNYLGADDGSTGYYVTPAGTVSGYWDYGGFGANNSNYAYTSFTGGVLNGVAVSSMTGYLRDVGGNADMNNGYMLAVEADGTLGHWYMPTGVRTAAFEATYGNWTTFTGGPVAGLTLTTLNGAAAGTAGTTTYRYLGTSGDAMYFDVDVPTGGGGGGGGNVPEPSGIALVLLGLAAAGAASRSRRAA